MVQPPSGPPAVMQVPSFQNMATDFKTPPVAQMSAAPPNLPPTDPTVWAMNVTTGPNVQSIVQSNQSKTETGVIKFRGANSTLSNFYLTPITVWNTTFKSTEHAYNYRKAIEMGQHTTAEEIRQSRTGREAMDIAKSIATNEHWSNVKQSIMYQLLQIKATQSNAFRQDLLASKGKSLVEDTVNEYWGRGRMGDGLNMLGRLLMVLRDQLASQPLPPSSPPQTSNSRFFQRKSYPSDRSRQTHCYNCGEPSHNVLTCRHQSPLKCFSCHSFGHKRKSCPNSRRFNDSR